MKQLVLKTIGITLAFIAVFVFVVYGIFALFFPKNTAYFYDGLGNDVKAVKFMQKAYNRSGELCDLDQLCVYAVKSGDNGLIAKHLGSLFEREAEFKDYADTTKKDGYFDRMATKYVLALYKTESDKTVSIQKASTLTKDYTTDAPMHNVLAASVSDGNKDAVSFIKTKIEEAYSSFTDLGKQTASQDLSVIEIFLAK